MALTCHQNDHLSPINIDILQLEGLLMITLQEIIATHIIYPYNHVFIKDTKDKFPKRLIKTLTVLIFNW